MSTFNSLASKDLVDKTVKALQSHNLTVFSVTSAADAKKKALELIPKGAEVFINTSVTLDALGLGEELNNSGNYVSLKNKMYAMNRETEGRAIAALSSAPAIVIGSAHAVSATGSLFIASLTGSNLASYAFGAEKVIFVVSTKKIVADDASALERIWKYVLPLESARARKAYSLPETFNSHPNEILTINGQAIPGRVSVILFSEDAGF